MDNLDAFIHALIDTDSLETAVETAFPRDHWGEAKPYLIAALAHADPFVRWRAAGILGVYPREPEIEHALLTAYLGESSAMVRKHLERAMRTMEPSTLPPASPTT